MSSQRRGSDRRWDLVPSLTGTLENSCPVATEIGSVGPLETVGGWIALAIGFLRQPQTAEGHSTRALVPGGLLTCQPGLLLKCGNHRLRSILPGTQIHHGVSTPRTDNSPIGAQDVAFVITLNPHEGITGEELGAGGRLRPHSRTCRSLGWVGSGWQHLM